MHILGSPLVRIIFSRGRIAKKSWVKSGIEKAGAGNWDGVVGIQHSVRIRRYWTS